MNEQIEFIRVTIEGGKVVEVIGIDGDGKYVTFPTTVLDYDTAGVYEGLGEDEFGNPVITYTV